MLILYKRTFIVVVLLLINLFFSSESIFAQCNCTDYLYVNDPSEDVTHKFTINPDGTIGAEIGNPWLSAGVITNAHGVVSDLEGNLYVSQIDVNPTTLYKLSCDGDVISSNFIPGWQRTLNMTTIGTTIYSIGRDPNGGPYMIVSYDLCTGMQLGAIQVPDNGESSWGLTTGLDGELYFTQSFGTTNDDHNLYTVSSDLSTITQIASIPNVSGYGTHGVTQDEFGNFYIVTTNATTSSIIYKVDPSGNVIQTISDTNLNQVGFGGSWGIKYNERTGKLYIGTLGEDCVAVIDAGGQFGDMTYEPGSGVGFVPGTYSKAVNIVRECCPVPPVVDIDTFYCGVPVGGSLDLQELLNCDGVICGASWQAMGTNMNLSLNNCEQSVVTLDEVGCGVFTLSNNNSTQCGSYSITATIEIGDVTAPVIAGDQTICEGEDPVAFTVTTAASGSNTITYQWQSSTTSCTSGFTDLSGETNSSYDAPASITQTTYYRVLAEIQGQCTPGSCTDNSNCLTIMVFEEPTASVTTTPVNCFGGSDGSATADVSGGTMPYTYLWSDGQTTATAGNLEAGSYTVTVTDDNGCTEVASGTVTSLVTDETCYDINITRN